MDCPTVCFLFALVASGIMLTCGQAARRILFLSCAFVGIPMGLAFDWNDMGPGPLLWVLSGAVAAVCLALTDSFHLKETEPRDWV